MKVLWILPLLIVMVTSEKCGKYYCAPNALCRNGHCHCAVRGRGDLFCHNSDFQACHLFQDPYLSNYVHERGSFPIPCRHRIVHLEHNGICDVEVFGHTEMKHSFLAYEVGVEVKITVGNETLALGFGEEPRDNVYTVNDEGNGTYLATWNRFLVGQQEISAYYVSDVRQKYWKICSRDCGFTVVFRPPTGTGLISHQDRVPGVTVAHKKESTQFEYEDSDFPFSVCANPETRKPILTYMSELNLNTADLALLHAWLDSGVDQGENDLCSDAMSKFDSECPTGQKKSNAVNLCGPMFVTHARRCFNKDGRIMNFFILCMESVCNIDSSNCQKLDSEFKKLGCNLDEIDNACSTYLAA